MAQTNESWREQLHSLAEAWDCKCGRMMLTGDICPTCESGRKQLTAQPWTIPEQFEERRAFWREVYLGAMRVPPLIEVPPLDEAELAKAMRCMPIQTGKPEIKIPTPAEIADAALAEFDKRFK